MIIQGETEMSDFYDAFQELKGLEDATFSFDKPGILKLNTFLNMDDDEDNTLIVVDPDAETAEDTQGKDYNGEVILKCDICGGLITKAPEDVVIDEETQKANVEEECPYCYNIGGYDIVGEVNVPETLEYEEVDEFGDRTNDTEKDAVGYDIPSDDNIEEGKEAKDLFEDYDKDAGKIAKFIEDAVNGLKNGEATNYRYKLDDRLAIFVGWSEGFDEDDDSYIHSEESPDWVVVAGIKVWTSDSMWSDFDYLNYPYYEDSGDAIDVTYTISPEENFTQLANELLSDYDEIKDLVITKEGKVVEHDDEEEGPYKITYYYDSSYDYDNSDTEEYTTFAEVNDAFEGRKKSKNVFGMEVLNGDGEVILSYSKDKVSESKNLPKKKDELEEDLSKDDVNIIGRKEAAKRFNKGEEIYVGLKGNRDLWGFVKDDETPTFKDVEDYVTDDGAVKASDIVYAVANTSKTESYSRKEKKSLKEEFSGGVLEFPSGDYVYVAVEGGKLYAGSATNTGIFHDYEIDIEGDEPTDSELQELYDMIVDEHPEYLDEMTESCKKKKGKRLTESRGDFYSADNGRVTAECWEKSTRTYNYEYVTLTVDTKEATGNYRWMNRPWEKFDFASAFVEAAEGLGYKDEAKKAVEQSSSIESALERFADNIKIDKHSDSNSSISESRKKGKKKIDESVKIISTLDDYEPWSGAVDTFEAIKDAGMVDDLDFYLEDIYPEGLTMTQLNDLLWFDGDSVLSDLGIYTEDAIDTAIQDAVDEAQGESFTDTDELESFLTSHIEDAMSGVSVSVDIYDEEVEITVENTTRSFALIEFTFEEEVEESLKEGKEVEDFYDVVYDTITGQKKIKGTSNPIRGCINYTQMGIDTNTGNMRARCRNEKEAYRVEKYVAEMFGKDGVTTTRRKEKYDKDFPISVIINVPEEKRLDDIDDKFKREESLTESVEGVTVTTDTDIVNVDVKDTDGVTVDVQGKDSVGNTEEATIEPVSDETKEEIVANSEEDESEEGAEGDMLSDEFDEFNEEEFDELGESYLKEVYDNVKSFKTTRGVMDKDRIKLEGIIEFNSGKKAKTSFVFEKYMTTPRGKFKLLGENLQLTSRKNAFILTGSIQERKLCMEALTYKYTAKDAKGGKSKQVYGTKKVTK